MEKKVYGNADTQETIHLISPIVTFDILSFYIRINLSFHIHSKEEFNPSQNIHLFLPLQVVEWSQDDMLRLIHFFSNCALNRLNALPKRVISILKKK